MGKMRKTARIGAAEYEDSDRKHLTGREVEKLSDAIKGDRDEARDGCLLLLMFRHGCECRRPSA